MLVARSPRALQRILWRPGELGLARAYVSGDLDVEGDLTDGLRRVQRPPRGRPGRGRTRVALAAIQEVARLGLLAPPPEPPRCELRVRGRRHSRARDQAVIAGHYDVPSAFYQLILDPSMAYSCAYWDPQTVDLAAAQRAKLELIVPQARPGAGPVAARHGLRLGLADHPRGPRPGPGDRRDLVPGAGRLRPAARPRPGPGRSGRGQDPGLPRPAGRALRRDRLGGDGRARRRGPVPGVLRRALRTAAAGRPAADPADVQDHPPRRRPVHRVLHRPRHGHAPGGGDDTADPGRGVRGPRGRGDAGALRAHDPGLAGELRGQPARDHHDPDRRTGPRLAPLPGRRRAGLRAGPDGRGPDPRRQAGRPAR